ncbi:MAG TPA: NAD(P)-dependent oxidoreductase, partial [Puia sp.]|nr:NAD(P)-dependent oxidoreductase [Puia sp.]
QSLFEAGAAWSESPADAARGMEAVISVVSDDQASFDVWLGDNGAMDALSQGSMVIECSTISHGHALTLANESTKRGLHYIDCPVTGWPEHAASATLTLLVGAHQRDFIKAEHLLAAFSSKIIRFGGPGSGTAYKLMINLMGAIQIAALAEAINFSEKLGLDKELVVQGIEGSVAASPQVKKNARTMAERTFDPTPNFSLGLRRKDTLYAVKLAKEKGCAVPLGEAALAWFAKAVAYGSGTDQAAVIQTVTGTRDR